MNKNENRKESLIINASINYFLKFYFLLKSKYCDHSRKQLTNNLTAAQLKKEVKKVNWFAFVVSAELTNWHPISWLNLFVKGGVVLGSLSRRRDDSMILATLKALLTLPGRLMSKRPTGRPSGDI